MLNLLLICLILVFIIDISGFVDTVKHWIWKWLYKTKEYRDFNLKPFDCSLCATWWSGLIYLCFTGLSWEMVAYVALLAYLTPIFKDIILFIKDLMIKIIDELYYIFKV